MYWHLLVRERIANKELYLFPFAVFVKSQCLFIGKWEHSGRWCSSNLISFGTHWCVFSALLGASRYQEVSHRGPRNFSNHANWAARSRWAPAWKLWLSAVRSLVVAHQIKKFKKKRKAPDWLSCLEATLNLGIGNDSGATSGINQMLSFEKCVWKQSRCIPGKC